MIENNRFLPNLDAKYPNINAPNTQPNRYTLAILLTKLSSILK